MRPQQAWPLLVRTFGRKNVLIVSNSAGTRDDAGLLQASPSSTNRQLLGGVFSHTVFCYTIPKAESVSRHLGVPVLLHAVKKPGCAEAIAKYFNYSPGVDVNGSVYPPVPIVDVAACSSTLSLPPPPPPSPPPLPPSSALDKKKKKTTTILVIGDRVMTDVILANRISLLRLARAPHLHLLEAVPVLTTTVWQMEGSGSRIMRSFEAMAMRRVVAWHRKSGLLSESEDGWQNCVRAATTTVQATVAQTKTKEPFYLRLMAPITRPIATRSKRVREAVEQFGKEGRQAQYGFRWPEGVHRARRLWLPGGGVDVEGIGAYNSNSKRAS